MSLFYKLFKPINPVEWDGRKTYEYNLKNKYSIFFKEIKSPKKDIQKLFIKLSKVFDSDYCIFTYNNLSTNLYNIIFS